MPHRSNHIVGFLLAVGSVYGLHFLAPDTSVYYLGAVGVLAYFAGVVIDAWIRITVYWVRRGTRGRKTWKCKGCGRRIYRISGDWILECKSCGWKPGFPVLRWFWHSVPIVEARRRGLFGGAVRTGIAATVLVGVLLVPVAASMCNSPDGCPQIVESVSDTVEGIEADTGSDPSTGAGHTSTAASTPVRTESSTTTPRDQTLTAGEIEREIHRYVNREREERGLSRMTFDPDLAEIARSHSQDMATTRYFSHTSPDGETMEDRYDRFGYDCRVQVSGNRYMTGAENIAYTYADQPVMRDSGSSVDYLGNETRIAQGLVHQWMNSQGHRENILRPHWNAEGIGVAIVETAEGTRVYATQNFC